MVEIDIAFNFLSAHWLFFVQVFVSALVLASTWLVGRLSQRRLKKLKLEKENLSTDAKQRIWEHALHEESDFNDRLNFFLLFEGVLLGVVGTLYSKTSIDLALLDTFACLGLAISLVWAYVQARNNYQIDSLRKRLEANLEEYEISLQLREKSSWPLRNRWLLTYIIPTLLILIWLAMLAIFEGLQLTL